jgi:hypothetical protein
MTELSFNAAKIEEAHNKLGYSLGWRFLSCPEARLRDAKTAIITLNPGGNVRDFPEWSQELGNAYAMESWKSKSAGEDKIQIQINRLCELIGEDINEVLTSHFVPFRSPSWNELQNRELAFEFSRQLWTWALSVSQINEIYCVGADACVFFSELLNAKELAPSLSGWGTIKVKRFVTNSGTILIGLPYLGRFALFGKPHRDKLFLESVSETRAHAKVAS